MSRHNKNIRVGSVNKLTTLGKFSIEDVLPYVTDRNFHRKYKCDCGNISVEMSSSRYHVFKRSKDCVCCGLEGKYFLLQRPKEQTDNRGHFNLFGEAADGPVLLTKDHIVPVSRGGSGLGLTNYQTLCYTCNLLKSNLIITLDTLKDIRRTFEEYMAKATSNDAWAAVCELRKKIIARSKDNITVEDNKAVDMY